MMNSCINILYNQDGSTVARWRNPKAISFIAKVIVTGEVYVSLPVKAVYIQGAELKGFTTVFSSFFTTGPLLEQINRKRTPVDFQFLTKIKVKDDV
jgi:hypothetical protein